MILIEFLFAPTVPSDPSPKNKHSVTSAFPVKTGSASGNDVNVTSSIIPIVNWSFGSGCFKLLYTATICSGVVSFEDKPYLPPTMIGAFSFP